MSMPIAVLIVFGYSGIVALLAGCCHAYTPQVPFGDLYGGSCTRVGCSIFPARFVVEPKKEYTTSDLGQSRSKGKRKT